MKKSTNKKRQCKAKLRFKILLVFMLIGIPHICASAYPQTARVSISVKNTSLEDVFKELEQKTTYVFLYKNEVIKGKGAVNINAENKLLTQVLFEILAPLGLNYAIDDNVIVINTSNESVQSPQQQSQNLLSVTGVVKDEKGEPLPGVTVVLKGTIVGTNTNIDGKYRLDIPKGTKEATIVYSFIGMETKEVKYTGQKNIDIVLKDGETTLKSVVVEAGIMQRNKLGFTGNTSSATGQELKALGNTNVLQSLSAIDPSFIINDNVISGSDPNAMLNIEIRGQSTMDVTATRQQTTSNANQPLFILDGFPVSLQEINDIDINRIESMTILKDAGSTAMYGSKGANGVVIVETVKPKSGQLMLAYNGDYSVEFADLSVYNMMNAAEKLEFERLAGQYDYVDKDVDITALNGAKDIHKLYYQRLMAIKSGVDTYWLSEPIRTAFTHSHSLNISGGEDKMLFDIGLNYRKQEGVMKDSERESYGANFRITYRGINKLNISNNASVSGTNANDGPWTTGNSFQQFVNANPYYKKRNDDGSIPMTLSSYIITQGSSLIDGKASETAYNPLHNAVLNSYERDRTFYFTNNTNMDWFVNDDLRVNGALSLRRTIGDNDQYIDPRNTMFAGVSYDKKGRYTSVNENNWSIEGRMSAVYTKKVARNHNFTFNLIGSLEERNARRKGFMAEAYPEGFSGELASGGRYVDGSPTSAVSKHRAVTGIFAFNYNYDLRYLLDFNINEEGSTAFGSNKRFQEFWSVGLGWNVDREKFIKDWKWLSNLKITGSMGTNGNQQKMYVTSSVYSYYGGNTAFGQAVYISQYGNPDLNWEKKKKLDFKIDAGLFDSRLSFGFNLYQEITSPQVIAITQKPSTGISEYPTNLGKMTNKGLEFTLLYYPIYDRQNNFLLGVRVGGFHYKSEFRDMGNLLDIENDILTESSLSLQSLLKYQDGYSPNSIWAVRSAGIDPATGKEIYIKKDGSQTFEYDIEDRVCVGDMTPKLRGTFGFSLIYQKLEANVTFRYSIGADKINRDLYNKVENITNMSILYNQDKRALYDRWKAPGDVAQFTDIQKKANSNPLSSRFLQREDYVEAQTGKITWNFSRDKWIQKLGLKVFKAGVSMNSLFRLSTVRSERSTDYPFARSVSLNLTARF